MFGDITETDKLILLYQLETHGRMYPEGVVASSDEQTRFILTSGEFVLWQASKRDFCYPEIADSHWLETTYRGQIAKLDCLQSHDAVLCPLTFSSSYNGQWHIHNGLLRMNLTSPRHQLELFSIANIQGNIHPLILFKDKVLQGGANITLMG